MPFGDCSFRPEAQSPRPRPLSGRLALLGLKTEPCNKDLAQRMLSSGCWATTFLGVLLVHFMNFFSSGGLSKSWLGSVVTASHILHPKETLAGGVRDFMRPRQALVYRLSSLGLSYLLMLLGLTGWRRKGIGWGAARAARQGASAGRVRAGREQAESRSWAQGRSWVKLWLVSPWEKSSETKSKYEVSGPCGFGGRSGSRRHADYSWVMN